MFSVPFLDIYENDNYIYSASQIYPNKIIRINKYVWELDKIYDLSGYGINGFYVRNINCYENKVYFFPAKGNDVVIIKNGIYENSYTKKIPYFSDSMVTANYFRIKNKIYSVSKKLDSPIVEFDLETEECVAKSKISKELKQRISGIANDVEVSIVDSFISSGVIHYVISKSNGILCFDPGKNEFYEIHFKNRIKLKSVIKVDKDYYAIDENDSNVYVFDAEGNCKKCIILSEESDNHLFSRIFEFNGTVFVLPKNHMSIYMFNIKNKNISKLDYPKDTRRFASFTDHFCHSYKITNGKVFVFSWGCDYTLLLNGNNCLQELFKLKCSDILEKNLLAFSNYYNVYNEREKNTLKDYILERVL